MRDFRIRIYFGKRLGITEFVRQFKKYSEAEYFCNGLGVSYVLEEI